MDVEKQERRAEHENAEEQRLTPVDPLPGDVFARRMRQERERLGFSQAKLGQRMAALLGENVEQTRITRIEQQTRTVRIDEAVVIAQVLDVPLSSLLNPAAVQDNEAAIQQAQADLIVAQQEWHEKRQEVERLTNIVQELIAERAHLARHSRAVDPDDIRDLDPDLAAAIDARVPAGLG